MSWRSSSPGRSAAAATARIRRRTPSHSELWHLPRENLTIAVTWNDDVVGRDANALPALVRIALADAN